MREAPATTSFSLEKSLELLQSAVVVKLDGTAQARRRAVNVDDVLSLVVTSKPLKPEA